MNREIKFRAWDGKKMRYPDGPKYVIRFDGVMGIFNSHSQDYSTVEWVVMEFTGLKDKNGKEIYEGDIVRISDEDGEQTETEVYYSGGGLVVEWNSHFNMGESDITTIGWAKEEGFEFEVIGNIFELPKD